MNNGSVFAYLHVIPSDGAEHIVPISQFPFCIGRAEHNRAGPGRRADFAASCLPPPGR